MSPGSSSRAPSRVCRLRGLPYSATDEEIAAFFSSYTLDEVYICRRDGRATGEAYVMFCDAAQASSAMEACNKNYLGSRYIEMFEAAEADLAAVKKVLEDSQLQGCVVRLRGLPYSATVEDVAGFFEGVPLADADDAVVFTTTVDGRPTGECYVELADRAAQSAAMTRHKELMGTRYIEIFHSSKMDKLQAQQAWLCMQQPALGRWGVQALRPAMGMHHGMMQPAMPHGFQPAMPRAMQPAVLAAAAAGSKVACEVNQLTATLQGTRLNGSMAGSIMSPMQQQQQQQQLYPPAYAQRPMMAPMHMQQLPQQMYYMPMQQGPMQGPMPGPYGMPAPAYSMPPSYPAASAQGAPTMVPTGHPRPMLVGGGQWMHAPAHWPPAPSWPASAPAAAAAAAGSAGLAMPARGMGVMQ
ncbi:hypothetical protein OEZ86_014445 [Tetradesmus obliquus]|nr:hypothetical protein OEZ86_014445 [Tetradesmus obliquus]